LNDMMTESLPVYVERFTTTAAVTVFP